MKVEQYIPINSLIHSLDPRTKLIITVFLISLTLLSDNFTTLYLIVSILVLMIILTQIRFSYIFAQLLSLIWLLIFTFLIYLVPTQEYSLNQLLYLWTLFTSKLIVLVLFVSVLSLTTSPLDLSDGLEYFLSPLKKIRIPIQDIILIIHLSLRFIPTLFQELERTIRAQSARGVDFKKGNILTRLKRLIPVMVLLFKNSFRRADELALALESRGYHLNKTRTKKLRMTIKDYLFLLLMGIILVIFHKVS
ncbi:MAG: energy-coupling factor transporter transmembrane component T [bacterium]